MCTYISCLHHYYERTRRNMCVNKLLFQAPESSPVVFQRCHPTCCSAKLSTFSLGNSKSSGLANAYVDSEKLDTILREPCSYYGSGLSQMASEALCTLCFRRSSQSWRDNQSSIIDIIDIIAMRQQNSQVVNVTREVDTYSRELPMLLIGLLMTGPQIILI